MSHLPLLFSPRWRFPPFALALCLLLVLAGCATVPTFPTVTDSSIQHLVNDYGHRVLQVSENRDKAHLYQFRLADLRSHGAAGINVGDHIIYIDYDLASKAHRDEPGYRTLLLMVVAHEVGHEVAGHVANLKALGTAFTVGQTAASIVSHAPGIVGLAGAAASWLFLGAGYASTQLYGRAAELEADRKAIEYWRRMGLDCRAWVRNYQHLADKGIQGNFRHPTEGLLEQAKELCPGLEVAEQLAPSGRPRQWPLSQEPSKPETVRQAVTTVRPAQTVSHEQLKDILEAHGKWVRSEGKEGRRASLTHANLRGASLSEADLQEADFAEADLREAKLQRVNLRRAYLFKANLQGADLEEGNLEDASLFRAQLHKANLYRANLQRAYLLLANLQQANLREANLRNADLSGAKLEGADLRGADLTNATGLTAKQVAPTGRPPGWPPPQRSSERKAAWIGIEAKDPSAQLAAAYGVNARGPMVLGVSHGGPAETAGIKTGDVIIKFGEGTINEERDLVQSLSASTPGETVVFTVIRDKTPIRLSVTLGEKPRGVHALPY